MIPRYGVRLAGGVEMGCALTVLGEVSFLKLVFLDLKGVLEKSLSLLSSDGNVDSNLLVSFDGKTSNGVSSLRFDWLLGG